jgi:hypothetical protein
MISQDDLYRIETAKQHKATAVDLRERAMVNGANGTALEWANRAEFFADEAVRCFETCDRAEGDRYFRHSTKALEKCVPRTGDDVTST